MATVSNSSLSQLYSNFSSKANTAGSTSVQDSVMSYFNAPNAVTAAANYATMATAIAAWIATVPNGYTNTVAGKGLRVQVIEADGKTAYDSNATTANIYTNINIPKSDFLTTGKYLINENQGTRSYNMGAALAQSGLFYQQKLSLSTNTNQTYIAVRQGLTSAEPLGNVVISLNA